MTEMQGRAGAPWYFWVVVAVSLLWNGLGVVLWSGTSLAPDTFLQGTPEAQRAYVSGLPWWSTVTWGLGVVGGLAGTVLLLLRQRRAGPVFGASLFGAVTNTMVYLTNPPPAGFFNPGLTAFIIGFALFLFWFAGFCKQRGIL